MRITPSTLRLLLLGSLGTSLVACGQSSKDGSGAGGSPGSGTGGRTSASGGVTNSSGGRVGAGGTSTGGMPEGTGGSLGGGGGSAPPTQDGCRNPEPLFESVETGFYTCEEGYLRRTRALECLSQLPRDQVFDWPHPEGTLEEGGSAGAGGNSREVIVEYGIDECSEDGDCAQDSYCLLTEHSSDESGGNCQNIPVDASEPLIYTYNRRCMEGCRQDSDCADDQLCLCGSLIGTCRGVSEIAGCRSDADCEPGMMCLLNGRTRDPLFSGARSFACQLPGDECQTDSDCGGGKVYCKISEAGRVCTPGAVCGRPFLVKQSARMAHSIEALGWLSGDRPLPAPSLPSDAALRERLIRHWTEVALMEHASVAAFARFALQLLSLGAPAELIEQSVRAQADEARHARVGFHLASHYSGAPLGPGPLDLSSALDDLSFEHILLTTVHEGCIGETRASLEVARAAELAEDPELRACLEQIAQDEARHAELAWKVVAWMLTQRPELGERVAREIEASCLTQITTQDHRRDSEIDALAAAHALLGDAEVEECRATADREVILPCARELLNAPGIRAVATRTLPLEEHSLWT